MDMSPDLDNLRRALHAFRYIDMALVFGSVARGAANECSDIDVAVAGPTPLSLAQRMDLAAAISVATGRNAAVVDLAAVTGTILAQALTTGRVVLLKDKALYAALLKKHVYHEADVVPLYRRGRNSDASFSEIGF